MSGYFARLAGRLSAGLAQVDSDRRDRHRDFVLSKQDPAGGFVGREPGSDLYYTCFALRAIGLTGALSTDRRDALAKYLDHLQPDRLNIVDLLSWLFAVRAITDMGVPDMAGAIESRRDALLANLASLRRADGGYAKSLAGAVSSTYHTFLAGLCHELLSRPVPDGDALVDLVRSRGRPDGGFVEIAPMKHSGTNPTAAAVGVLTLLDRVDEPTRANVARYLQEVKTPEGGIAANAKIGRADTLSTFTGAWTAEELGLRILEPGEVRRFLETVELHTGGFRAADWDGAADVEYTFYGLGLWGLFPKA